MHINVAGIDVGFTKTGFSVIRMGPRTDTLILATTLPSDFTHTGNGAAEDDIISVFNVLDKIDALLNRYEIAGAFVEVPHGGAQNARAGRCMGIATGWCTAMFHYRHTIGFEFYTPLVVEKTLGINLTQAQAKELGLKRGESTKYKKERSRDLVLSEFPRFADWPETKALAEDAYDSVAAFLCGRKQDRMYGRFRGKVVDGVTECSVSKTE
jgi:Holliday junction resolvasome RuvABC endonuclease subunit